MKILCIGSATYDINLPIDTYPKENTSVLINTKIECGGGTASNAAYLLAKWKMNSYFAGLIGRDENGLNKRERAILIRMNFLGMSLSHKLYSLFFHNIRFQVLFLYLLYSKIVH